MLTAGAMMRELVAAASTRVVVTQSRLPFLGTFDRRKDKCVVFLPRVDVAKYSTTGINTQSVPRRVAPSVR